MKPIVTAILLNWKRPENLVEVIKSIRSQNIPIDIWLWDNSNSEHKFDVDQRFQSSINLKCFPRWCLASMVQTEYFFVIDDDIMFTDGEVISDCIQYHKLIDIEDLILGQTGVILNKEMIYFNSEHFSNVERSVGVDIVKGRFMFMKQSVMNKVTMDASFTCDDIKISSQLNHKVLPAFLHNRFKDLQEGEEALFRTEGQRELRQLATKQFFCKSNTQ